VLQYFFGQGQSMNSSTNEIVIFHETTKISTHENKSIHSIIIFDSADPWIVLWYMTEQSLKYRIGIAIGKIYQRLVYSILHIGSQCYVVYNLSFFWFQFFLLKI